MLRPLREWLSLLLFVVLPFHAFLVTVGTRIIVGPDQGPLSWLALWKEGLLALILIIAGIEWLMSRPKIRIDKIDAIILALLVLSVVVTMTTHKNWSLYTFGFRYDFVPLVAFLVLRRVPWTELFFIHAKRTLLIVGSIVAGYGIISFFLPSAFFHWLGYSDLHSLYVPGKPIAAFQMIGETGLRRIQSTMSGPNQLGLWMLIPLAVAITRKKAVSIVCLIAIAMSFSRAAWISAFIMVAIVAWPYIKQTSRRMHFSIGGTIVAAAILLSIFFPSIIVRITSSRGHIEGPIQAIHTMIRHPFGRGLGMAGPASNRVSDACVLLRETDDPSWAAARPDLCVFLGDTQVQPVDRVCSCPFLPENWYLQIGAEMGWIGFALYIALMVLVFRGINRVTRNELRVAFIGLSVAALFLHAFEDAAVSYGLWVLIATAVTIAKKRQHT